MSGQSVIIWANKRGVVWDPPPDSLASRDLYSTWDPIQPGFRKQDDALPVHQTLASKLPIQIWEKSYALTNLVEDPLNT